MALSSGASGATGFAALGTVGKNKHTKTNKTWQIAGTEYARIIILIFHSFCTALRHLYAEWFSLHVMKSTERRTSQGTSVKHARISVLS